MINWTRPSSQMNGNPTFIFHKRTSLSRLLAGCPRKMAPERGHLPRRMALESPPQDIIVEGEIQVHLQSPVGFYTNHKHERCVKQADLRLVEIERHGLARLLGDSHEDIAGGVTWLHGDLKSILK